MRTFLASLWLVCLCALPAAAGAGTYEEYLDDPEGLTDLAEPASAYYAYLKARRASCTGDGAAVEPPAELALGGARFSFRGPTLEALGPDPDGVFTLGVLGAPKDFSDESRAALRVFFERFQKAGADAVLLLGDLAATETELTQILLFSAERKWPVLALIGNTEGRAAFNNAFLAALKVAPNLINLDFIRRVDFGAVSLVNLPGYQDRRFMHQSSGCTYKPADVEALKALLPGSGTTVLVSHGPPAGRDAHGLDVAVEAGNVGDPVLAGFLRDQKIAFGLFSHILESGGRAVDAQGKPVQGGVMRADFFLNVGSANPLAWQLNGGKTSCGMGAIARFKGGQGSFEFVNLPCK
ncbi:MAG TPA: hypothetical protein PK668_15590 [Myxococcota bacterium]|nr:hypothetical protein [Myxococcota bacterium]HRY94318.1 hypothetical protein [Myxococcota bacterium]HSA21554.1 hypothetical protein [Myxococcota bacterium]